MPLFPASLQVQEIQADPGTILEEYISTINNCFPEEIVKYALMHLLLNHKYILATQSYTLSIL